MLSNIAEVKRKNLYVLGVLIFAFFVGWYLRANITDGIIFVCISAVNYLAMQLGRGKANITLAVFGIIAALLAVNTMFISGPAVLWIACSIGFFNSLMFPNIFA